MDGTMRTQLGLRAYSTFQSPFKLFKICLFACRFKGSDDYLRTKFEEYVSAALASVRYRDFVAKGEVNGVMITGGSGTFPSTQLVLTK